LGFIDGGKYLEVGKTYPLFKMLKQVFSLELKRGFAIDDNLVKSRA